MGTDGTQVPTTADLDPDERILGPVIAFDEMVELALASKLTSCARSMQAQGGRSSAGYNRTGGAATGRVSRPPGAGR